MTSTNSDKVNMSQNKGNPRDSPAQRAVFETCELLEAILVELPVLDLLFATQTCKAWESTFESSQKIRKLLFESKLPAYEGQIDGTDVNSNAKCNRPWIFRASFKPKDRSAHGRILVVSLPIYSFDWTIYAPTDRSQRIRINYLSLTTWQDARETPIPVGDPVSEAKSKIGSITKMKWHTRDNTLIDERTLDVEGLGPYRRGFEAVEAVEDAGKWEGEDSTLLCFLSTGVRTPARKVGLAARGVGSWYEVREMSVAAKKREALWVRFFSDEDVVALREWEGPSR